MRIEGIAKAIALFAILAVAACSGNRSEALPGSGGAAAAYRSLLGKSLQAGHVYIVNIGVQLPYKVYEFPIVDGVAASTSDAVLNVAAPPGIDPLFADIAVDPSGDLAALEISTTENSGGKSQLVIYKAGSTGDDPPSSTLIAPPCYEFDSLAFDADSNIYIGSVTCDQKAGYLVYSAGSTGNTAPVAFYPFPQIMWQLTVANAILYSASTPSIAAYSSPLSNPVQTNTWCLPPPPQGSKAKTWRFSGQFAVDAASDLLYVPESRGERSRISIYPLNASRCPARANVAERIEVSGKPFVANYAAFNDNYLFVSKAESGLTYEIVAHRGLQVPVATLNYSGKVVFGP